jgi:hypothetical protein
VTNRVADYCGFAVRFVGLGYLVLWPFATANPLGVSRLCRPEMLPWRLLCDWPQFIHLTPGLHLIGLFCAGLLAIHLALRLAARIKRARAARTNTALALTVRVPAALTRTSQRPRFETPLPKVKPRSEFGLRPGPRRRGDSALVSPASKAKALAE